MLNIEHVKKVAFPHEHGSWGFFLEPIILALIISDSTNGIIISICSFCLFLAYQPSSYILKGKPKYLLPYANIFLIIYLTIASYVVVELHIGNADISFLIPFYLAIILMLIFKILEFKNLNRNIVVELIPQFAVALMACSIILAGDWGIEVVLGFFVVILSRSCQTVFYVNSKLKLFKDHEPNRTLVNTVGVFFLVLLIILALNNYSPWLSVIALVILLIRAVIGLQNSRKNEIVKIVGIKEFIYGFLFVVINVIGYIYNL